MSFISRSNDGHKCWCFNRNGRLQIDQLILYNAAKQQIANLCETIKPWLCLYMSMTITMSIISAHSLRVVKVRKTNCDSESKDRNRLMLKGKSFENDGKAKEPQLINGNYLIHLSIFAFAMRDGWRKRKGYNLIIISFFSLSSQLDCTDIPLIRLSLLILIGNFLP